MESQSAATGFIRHAELSSIPDFAQSYWDAGNEVAFSTHSLRSILTHSSIVLVHGGFGAGKTAFLELVQAATAWDSVRCTALFVSPSPPAITSPLLAAALARALMVSGAGHSHADVASLLRASSRLRHAEGRTVVLLDCPDDMTTEAGRWLEASLIELSNRRFDVLEELNVSVCVASPVLPEWLYEHRTPARAPMRIIPLRLSEVVIRDLLRSRVKLKGSEHNSVIDHVARCIRQWTLGDRELVAMLSERCAVDLQQAISRGDGDVNGEALCATVVRNTLFRSPTPHIPSLNRFAAIGSGKAEMVNMLTAYYDFESGTHRLRLSDADRLYRTGLLDAGRVTTRPPHEWKLVTRAPLFRQLLAQVCARQLSLGSGRLAFHGEHGAISRARPDRVLAVYEASIDLIEGDTAFLTLRNPTGEFFSAEYSVAALERQGVGTDTTFLLQLLQNDDAVRVHVVPIGTVEVDPASLRRRVLQIRDELAGDEEA